MQANFFDESFFSTNMPGTKNRCNEEEVKVLNIVKNASNGEKRSLKGWLKIFGSQNDLGLLK